MTSPSSCEFRHEWNGALCRHCGAPRPLSPAETYRLEKMKRGLPVQQYKADGSRDRRHDPGTTHLGCPKCKCEVLVMTGRVRKYQMKKTKKLRCTGCDYVWRTASKEAFGGTRQIEVRG